MNSYQLDIFETIPDEIDILRSQIIDLNNMSHSVRKSVFKKVSDLEKKLTDIAEIQSVMEERLAILERHFLGLPQDKIEPILPPAIFNVCHSPQRPSNV